MAQQYFYHIAERKNIDKILEQGLIPKIGRNSRAVNEEKPRVYLSNKRSLFYWGLIVKDPVVLRIESSYMKKHNIKISHKNYGDYAEWFCYENIPAESIEVTSIKPGLSEDQNQDLCLSHLGLLSSACKKLAYYELYHDCEDENTRKIARQRRTKALAECRILNRILPRLDFKKVSNDEIIKLIQKQSHKGICVFSDTYSPYECFDEKEDLRLWQLLGLSENANRDTKQLYKLLQKIFDNDILTVNTRNWTD